ncbi:MAG: TerB family tellurite resistance protein [Gilvibacter sp.]
MSFTDLFESGEHSRNLGHFASLVTLAAVSGSISESEEKLLKRFSRKLEILDSEYKEIMKNPSGYPINPPNSAEKRLERMFDLFKLIFVDHEIEAEERELVERYAIGLGFSEESATKLIKKSVTIFSGGLDFEDYRFLLNR